jgi:hypothetical protein
VGAIRHCYRSEDERGIRWSEEVLSVVPERLRAMRVFDLHGMAIVEMDRSELVVWQILEPTGHGTTRLTFRTTLQDDEPTSRQVLWFLGRGSVEEVFAENLENIARAIEEGDAYSRRHSYRPLADWELARGAEADARESAAKASSP